jgi:hypothetical protein
VVLFYSVFVPLLSHSLQFHDLLSQLSHIHLTMSPILISWRLFHWSALPSPHFAVVGRGRGWHPDYQVTCPRLPLKLSFTLTQNCSRTNMTMGGGGFSDINLLSRLDHVFDVSVFFFAVFQPPLFCTCWVAKRKPPGAEQGGETRHPEAWR